MKLFEVEAYKAWAAMELDQEKQVEEAENYMKEAEDHLNTAMEDAMDEFRRFEEEMNQMAKSEYDSLVGVAERARNMGKTMEKLATIAAKNLSLIMPIPSIWTTTLAKLPVKLYFL
ncbi:hypothetical protein HAX54_042807 [Datura stramonium]|uniref:Uncharacterized protein n=1 Tax=Datura stramonium TaxID=4076 RepID=A0ABS8SMA0_DATST|nr:hypothetical protein [Datura stramonium]